MQDYKTEIGLRIKENRKKMKLTQEMLAEKLGISVKHLSEVERGIAGLSIENLILLSTFFDVSLDYLIKGDRNDDPLRLTVTLPDRISEEKRSKIKALIRNLIEII